MYDQSWYALSEVTTWATWLEVLDVMQAVAVAVLQSRGVAGSERGSAWRLVSVVGVVGSVVQSLVCTAMGA